MLTNIKTGRIRFVEVRDVEAEAVEAVKFLCNGSTLNKEAGSGSKLGNI